MKKILFIMLALMTTTLASAQTVDQLALKKLVDICSILADDKDIKSQMDLFTDDAELYTRNGESVFVMKGKEEIENAFTSFIAQFDVVYHFNGQQTVEIAGDTATGISYCFETLIGNGKRNQSGVRFHDTYIKQNGKWLIKRRESIVMYTILEDMK